MNKLACLECSCAKRCIVAVLVCLSLFILILLGIMIYYLCNFFGIRYFMKGGYYYDYNGDKPESILAVPQPFVADTFQQSNILIVLSNILIAINLPKIYEEMNPEVEQNILLSRDSNIEPVWGEDNKLYAVFMHFRKLQITILCWINFRYFKQWICLFNSELVQPFYLCEEHSLILSGKCWYCINYLYKLTRANMWDTWEKNYKANTKQLVIAGHSLAGAMAPIAALDLRLNDDGLNGNNVFVQISGAPRCGDVNFVREYNSLIPNTWNVINTYDLITLTPPVYAKSHLYAHVGRLVYFAYPSTDGLAASHWLKTYIKYFKQKDVKVAIY